MKFRYKKEILNKIPDNKREKAIYFHQNRHLCNAKAVLCIETNVKYESVNAAAKSIGVCNSVISGILSGRIKHAKGFTFKRI